MAIVEIVVAVGRLGDALLDRVCAGGWPEGEGGTLGAREVEREGGRGGLVAVVAVGGREGMLGGETVKVGEGSGGTVSGEAGSCLIRPFEGRSGKDGATEHGQKDKWIGCD